MQFVLACLMLANVGAEFNDQVLTGGGETAAQERHASTLLVRLEIFHSLHSERTGRRDAPLPQRIPPGTICNEA